MSNSSRSANTTISVHAIAMVASAGMRTLAAIGIVWGCSCYSIDTTPFEGVDAAVLVDAQTSFSIGGTVNGMWNGAAVSLRLATSTGDELLNVNAGGEFTFNTRVPNGTPYSVSIETQPSRHDCDVMGGSGTIVDTDVSAIRVICEGPAVDVQITGPRSIEFDTAQLTQSFDFSVALQDVQIIVTAPDATAIQMNGAILTSGVPSEAVSLALGANAIEVDVEVATISQRYAVTLNRGARILEQYVYGKASNTDPGDEFGTSISVYGDRLAVGALKEDSGSVGTLNDQTDNSREDSGAVYVFRRVASTWVQEAYLKPTNTDAGDAFGSSVSLSGTALAVGAPMEDSNGTGVNGPAQGDNSAPDAGAVYVFRRNGTTWLQQAHIKASNSGAGDFFGILVALDGDTLAVGAPGEDTTATDSGAVYVFRFTTFWAEEAMLKASNANFGDRFGVGLAVSGDTIVAGAVFEDGGGTGIDGDQADNSAADAGAAYVFRYTGASWTQEAYLKASNTETGDFFGTSVAVLGDLLVVAAPNEDSGATGANGNQADNSVSNAGAVYVFRRIESAWYQESYLKASNPGAGDQFGLVAVSRDLVAVGTPGEDGDSSGIDGPANDDATSSGAVYLFKKEANIWEQEAYIKASTPDVGDRFGRSVALSGETLFVGAASEASSATGLDGAKLDNSAPGSGAVYWFR